MPGNIDLNEEFEPLLARAVSAARKRYPDVSEKDLGQAILLFVTDLLQAFAAGALITITPPTDQRNHTETRRISLSL